MSCHHHPIIKKCTDLRNDTSIQLIYIVGYDVQDFCVQGSANQKKKEKKIMPKSERNRLFQKFGRKIFFLSAHGNLPTQHWSTHRLDILVCVQIEYTIYSNLLFYMDKDYPKKIKRRRDIYE